MNVLPQDVERLRNLQDNFEVLGIGKVITFQVSVSAEHSSLEKTKKLFPFLPSRQIQHQVLL